METVKRLAIFALLLTGCTKHHHLITAAYEAPLMPVMTAPQHGAGNVCGTGWTPVKRLVGAVTGKPAAGDKFVPIRDSAGVIAYTEVCRKQVDQNAVKQVSTMTNSMILRASTASTIMTDSPQTLELSSNQYAEKLRMIMASAVPDYTNRTDVDSLCNFPKHFAGSSYYDWPTSIAPLGTEEQVTFGAVFRQGGHTFRAFCR